MSATSPPSASSSKWAALHHPGFARYTVARLFSTLAVQAQAVAVGWQVYDLTNEPIYLGLVGLAQFLPALLLVLWTGAASDRFERRYVMAAAIFGQALCALTLLFFSWSGSVNVWAILLVVLAFGVVRAFLVPAQQSFLPNLVPAEHLSNAVAINAGLLKLAVISGPLIGGLLYEVSAATAYSSALVAALAGLALTIGLPATRQVRIAASPGWQELSAGFRYIWRERIVLGAISLDLFAVLLGGAIALLPVYAKDILHAGPLGLGLLRAAPGIGGVVVAVYLTVRPIRDHAGLIMFTTVAIFGLSITVFGLSDVLWLSFAALCIMGASDLVSVYIRSTLVQLWTPDQLRGRVSAVNAVFLNASNEIGAFRAGTAAAFIGALPAVVLGGIVTLGVTAAFLKWFPELRRVRHLDGRV